MQRLPKQALFLGQALQARYDCSEQPLPNEFNVLLCLLDGAERRQRVQARCNGKSMRKRDLPVDVQWIPADEITEVSPDREVHKRHFGSLRRAIDFVMRELSIASRANVWITTAKGNLTIEQIEQLR